MRVNIQFSVDLDDVPEHIIRVLEDANHVVSDLANISLVPDIKEMVGNNNFTDSIKTLSDYREILLDLDHRLDDCMRIMIGYQQFIANPQPHTSIDGAPPFVDGANPMAEKIKKVSRLSTTDDGGFE
jgi:hypothetical protein